MIKVKDIAEKYGEYGIDEEKLKEILIEPKPKTIWDLKTGDKIYWIDRFGDVLTGEWREDEEGCHDIRMMNSIFLTEKEADFETERRKVETEMLKYGGTRDMMSLGGSYQPKFFITYSHCDKVISDAYRSYMNYQGCIFFKTRKDAENAIDKIGEDRIKKYIFNVKE